jgi:hypothetical protein
MGNDSNEPKKMVILVTGGSGLVGKAIEKVRARTSSKSNSNRHFPIAGG